MEKKHAISWLELILFVLLVLGGMAIWTYVEGQVDVQKKADEPLEESFQQAKEVPLLQAKLSEAQGELAALQSKLVEQRIEVATKKLLLDEIIADHSPLGNPSIASLELITTPPDLLQSYVNTKVEQATAIALIDALEVQLKQITSDTVDLAVVLDDQKENPREQAITQAKLSIAQKSMEAMQDELVNQRLNLAQQTAVLETFVAAYPQLSRISRSTSSLTQSVLISGDVLQRYNSARLEAEIASHLVEDLEVSVAKSTSVTAERSRMLAEAQQAASQDYISEKNSFVWKKRWLTLGWAGSGTLLLGLPVLIIALWLTAKTSTKCSWRFILGGAIGLLFILIAYELFDFMGAIIISVVVLITVLMLISRSNASSESDPQEEQP